ncbi:hypothetical protein Bca4012_085895 [Brassica carinata]
MLSSLVTSLTSKMSTSDHASVVSLNLFVALLCACIVIGHLLEEHRWINESITALLIGLGTGVVILLISRGKNSHLLFCLFVVLVLYVIDILCTNGFGLVVNALEVTCDCDCVIGRTFNVSRFQVKKKQFFRNFVTIMAFGAIGTIISCTVISLGAMQFFKKLDIATYDLGDILAIGAIFAATDSVCTLQVLNQDETPLLYSLVFGEGVVNDATSVVLFNAIQSFDLTHLNHEAAFHFLGNFLYLFILSTVLGVATGLISAYVIKKLYFGRHSTDREVALMMLMAYLSYMLAELFALSGILTVFFCGIVMSHYTWHNVTESSRVTTKHTFATLSFLAETFIFLYVGMDALDIEKWRFVSDSPGTSVAVSSILMGLVMLGRAAFVFPLSFLSNLSKKNQSEKIDIKQQVVIWWAGLMRGAVSMALAYNKFTRSGHTELRGNAIMITSTITVCLFSTMVFGMLTKPLIRHLMPHQSTTTSMLSDDNTPKSIHMPLLDGEQQDSFVEFSGSHHDVPRPDSLRGFLMRPARTVHHYWRQFDDAFMRPVFGGRGFVPFVPGSPIERSTHDLSKP